MSVHTSTENVLKPMGLLQLLRTIIIMKKRNRQLKTLNMVLRKSISGLNLKTNLTDCLKRIEGIEKIINEVKVIVGQSKEENRNIFKEIGRETQKAEIIAQSQNADALEYLSGMKRLIKILLESKTQDDFMEKFGELLTWLEFESSSVTVCAEEEVIGRQQWKTFTIKSAKCRTLDDMPADIRRRHMGLRDIFEGAGGKFFYRVIPFKGTEIILKIPFGEQAVK